MLYYVTWNTLEIITEGEKEAERGSVLSALKYKKLDIRSPLEEFSHRHAPDTDEGKRKRREKNALMSRRSTSKLEEKLKGARLSILYTNLA